MPRVDFDLSTPKGLHNAIVAALIVLAGPVLIASSVAIVNRSHSLAEAGELVESGLIDLANNKIEQGLAKLELAEAKHDGIVYERTIGCPNPEVVDLTGLTAEQKFARLKGIKVLRPGEPWVDEELRSYYDSRGDLDELIAIEAKQSRLWQENEVIAPAQETSLAELEYARQLWRRGDREETRKHLNRIAALYPWNTGARKFAREVYEAMGLRGEWKRFDRLRLSERHLSALQDVVALNCGDQDQKNAGKKLDDVLREHPECGVALLLRASRSIDNSDYKQAMSDANQLVKYYPDFAEAYVLRARIKLSMDDAKSAVQDLNRAHELFPNSLYIIESRLDAASQLSDARSQETISQDCRRLILAQDDGLRGNRTDFVDHLKRLGRYNEAEAVIDDGISAAMLTERIGKLTDFQGGGSAPGFVHDLRLKKAEMRAAQKDYGTAISILSELVTAEPENLSLYDTKAAYLLHAGRKQEALDTINLALAKQGNPFNLGHTALWPTDSDTLPQKLPEGSFLKSQALERIQQRATIYDSMGKREAALADRRKQLQILLLVAESEKYRFFEAIKLAEQLNDSEAALRVARALRNTLDNAELQEVDAICVELTTSPKVDFARVVVQEFANRYPGRPVVMQALNRLNHI